MPLWRQLWIDCQMMFFGVYCCFLMLSLRIWASGNLRTFYAKKKEVQIEKYSKVLYCSAKARLLFLLVVQPMDNIGYYRLKAIEPFVHPCYQGQISNDLVNISSLGNGRLFMNGKLLIIWLNIILFSDYKASLCCINIMVCRRNRLHWWICSGERYLLQTVECIFVPVWMHWLLPGHRRRPVSCYSIWKTGCNGTISGSDSIVFSFRNICKSRKCPKQLFIQCWILICP